MDKRTTENLSKIHPTLARRVTDLIKNLALLGIEIRVVQGLRTFAEQDELFRKRPKVTNARGGQSNHNFGLACDVCPFKDGAPQWNDTAGFIAIGREAKRLGLEWGGDWKFLDKPHIQLKGLGIKECLALYNRGGLSAVWNKWNGVSAGIAAPEHRNPAPTEILEYGDRGEPVKQLQTYLVHLKLMRAHEIDGDFGKITKRALIAFQRQNNLTADGIAGDGTKAKLKAATEGL